MTIDGLPVMRVEPLGVKLGLVAIPQSALAFLRCAPAQPAALHSCIRLLTPQPLSASQPACQPGSVPDQPVTTSDAPIVRLVTFGLIPRLNRGTITKSYIKREKTRGGACGSCSVLPPDAGRRRNGESNPQAPAAGEPAAASSSDGPAWDWDLCFEWWELLNLA